MCYTSWTEICLTIYINELHTRSWRIFLKTAQWRASLDDTGPIGYPCGVLSGRREDHVEASFKSKSRNRRRRASVRWSKSHWRSSLPPWLSCSAQYRNERLRRTSAPRSASPQAVLPLLCCFALLCRSPPVCRSPEIKKCSSVRVQYVIIFEWVFRMSVYWSDIGETSPTVLPVESDSELAGQVAFASHLLIWTVEEHRRVAEGATLSWSTGEFLRAANSVPFVPLFGAAGTRKTSVNMWPNIA